MPTSKPQLAFFLLVGTALGFFFLTASAQPPLYPDKASLLVYRDNDGKEHPIRTAADWTIRRKHILEGMQAAMGPLPDAKQKVPLDVQYTESVDGASYVRKKLTFAVAKGERVPAYLLLPHKRTKKVPAVLCLHQTNGKLGSGSPVGLGGRPSLYYAHHLAERGYVTLAPDYPGFGSYPFELAKSGFQSGSMKAVWNNMCAVDLLQQLPEVDSERIGCIGHSLGGHNTMFTAAFDERIKALVSCCGFCSFPTYYKGEIAGWTSNTYMPRIRTAYDLKPEKVPFDFPEVVAAFAPRAFLAVAPLRDDNFDVDGVKDCIRAAQPVFKLLGAEQKLAALHPDCGHDFSTEARKSAYEWLDRWLK
jgi:pimeloyl-ACP methyl ester carboxylesterase